MNDRSRFDQPDLESLMPAVPFSRRGFLVIDAFSRIIRLGEGVSQTGRLSEPAMARTLDALKVCAAKLGRANVDVIVRDPVVLTATLPRFLLTGFLVVNIWATVVKMLGRHLFNLKYVMVLNTPYFSINI